MRTNIDIDDKLMKKAIRASGEKTKKGAVVAALQLLVNLKEQEKVRDLWGIAEWEGDLEKSRLSRFEGQEW
jgi:Arc/MetJ family transcription regulator